MRGDGAGGMWVWLWWVCLVVWSCLCCLLNNGRGRDKWVRNNGVGLWKGVQREVLMRKGKGEIRASHVGVCVGL